MHPVRSTRELLAFFREKHYCWHWSEGHPAKFLPGDFICVLHDYEGHSGIVVQEAPSNQTPTVVELPGPSTQLDLGTYDPTSTNDVRLGSWSKGSLSTELHYLGRLLLSKLPP